MRSRSRKLKRWVRRKNRRKIFRTILQYMILIYIGYLIVTALFTLNKYEPSNLSTLTNSNRFIAISYFGVARSGTSDHISQKELKAQLNELYKHGYRTISQQDIIDFYELGKQLPEKALFLAFEDGRNDSALFSNKILEKLNYKATMLVYANKLGDAQGKFLQVKDLKSMSKHGYWEVGTNGYRLAYINILNEDNEYFEYLTQEEFINKKNAYTYNHYLMDFIRDENGIPIENVSQLEQRISFDYDEVDRIFSAKLGYIPKTYMIMHADSLYNGMPALVEKVNDEKIKELFQMHFNREGNMLNSFDDDIYNLTRVQPAPYWRTNHLLMKLWVDTDDHVDFVVGDTEEASNWSITNGVAEFSTEEIALTTLPGKQAKMSVNNLQVEDSFSMDVTLGGHSSGVQTIELGRSNNSELLLRLRLQEKNIYIEEIDADGVIERLLSVKGKSKELEDIPISLTIHNNLIDVSVNGKKVLENESFNSSITNWNPTFTAESLKEENRWEDEGDNIYDGVFKKIKIYVDQDNQNPPTVLYSNELKGVKKFLFETKNLYDNLIDWAIEKF